MYLKSIELSGFKSFGKKTEFTFGSRIAAIVGPNGSGKCVTGDTLLKRKMLTQGRELFEDIAIVDIRSGDEVLTLDEKTGRLIGSRVRALKDMGTREIFEITTATGKKIRTTDTHPYLALIRNPHHPRVAIFIDGANVESSMRRMNARVDYAGLRAAFGGNHVRAAGFYQAYFKAAGQEKFFGRLKHLGYSLITKPLKIIRQHDGNELKKANFDVEIAVDAMRKLDEYDTAVLFSGDSDFAYLVNALQARGKRVVVAAPYRATGRELRESADVYLNAATMPFVSFAREKNNRKGPRGGHHTRLSPALPILEQVYPFVKGGAWTKAEDLAEGQMVATMNSNGKAVYERIVKIERRPAEHVYDIEVQSTHNFVANRIIAHNSNVAEGFRFVLGEQSMKSLRSKRGEDLIWGGSPALPRMNRAGVKVVFDNSKRLLDLDFKEVTVERVVYRDGQNDYLLNGTVVRLKDVIRLLAGANIGGSGYQIISQGEADRILNASPRERREMVEDALGLKLYQHKKAESERKLEETAINIEKTKSLRREIAPHLNFLRVQVQRIEKAREMKDELAVKLNEYLARENAWITQEDARLLRELRAEESELKTLGSRAAEARGKRSGAADDVIADLQIKIGEREMKLSEARRESEKLGRELGRAEGALEANTITVEQIVPVPHVRGFTRELSEAIAEAERESDVDAIKSRLAQIRERIRAFVEGLSGAAPETNEEVRQQVEALARSLERVRKEEAALAGELETLRKKVTEARDAGFIAERDLLELESRVREAQAKLNTVSGERSSIAALRQRFEEEVREGIALIGAAVYGWEKEEIPEGALLEEDRHTQEKRRREIERLKIKIEESGVGGGDAVVKEFNQTKEREEFLARELSDLESSADKLHNIIAELEKTIDARFTEGVKHINAALQNFFAKLFGGGHAKLEIEEAKPPRRGVRPTDILGDEEDSDQEDSFREEEDLYAGLSIDVSLPRKKIRGLDVLSGGERALTSIALIFSMSQVNPPPFLILDETDAALDEANSRRYADMIQELGSKSQLIVITHNRATMAAAGELYGVTMAQDGVSKLLSVKLEEAERVAK